MVDCLTEFNSRMDASKHELGYHDNNALPDLLWRRREKSNNTKMKRT